MKTTLTCHEIEILQLMTQCISRKEIAARLHYAPGTVGMRMDSMFKKLNVHTAQQAVAAAQRQGLVTL